MKKYFLIMFVGVLLALAGGMTAKLAAAPPPAPPGQNPCTHGNSQKPCKDDPQPEHGQDCLEHGKMGGQNEDHCKDETTTTTTTTTQPTTTTTTTSIHSDPPPTTTDTPTTTTTTTNGTTQSSKPKPNLNQPGMPLSKHVNPVAPKHGKCPAGTKLFKGKCHGVIKGQG